MPQNSGSTIFRKKPPDFLKFIGRATPFLVLFSSDIMDMVYAESLLSEPVFTKSIKVPGWQPGPQKSGSTIFRKKILIFLKFIGPVTTLWVVQPSQIMHMVSPEALPARAVFARSIKMLGWHPRAPKFREHDLPKKTS